MSRCVVLIRGEMNTVERVVRVFSVTFLGLGFISWICFAVDFCVLMIKHPENNEDGLEPYLYPLWAVAVCGPVLHGLALIHAVMCWNRIASNISHIVGSLTSLLFLMYITANGYVMISTRLSGYSVYHLFFGHDWSLFEDMSLLNAVFWALHLACWPWFNFKYERTVRSPSEAVCSTQDISKVDKKTRLTSIIFLGLCFIAWIVLIVGLDMHEDYEAHTYRFFGGGYVLTGVFALGLVVHGLALIHSVMFFNRIASIVGRIVGSVTFLLFMIYITVVGFVMINYGLQVIEDDYFDYDDNISDKLFTRLFFAGSLMSVVFWAFHLAMWPWFNYKNERSGGSRSQETALLINEDDPERDREDVATSD